MSWLTHEELREKGQYVYCDDCGRLILCISEGITAYDIFFVCKCNERSFASPSDKEKGRMDKIDTKREWLEKTGDVFKCTICRRELFKINEENINELSFDVICTCGKRYSNIRE